MSQNVKSEEREAIVLENKGQKIFGILHRPICEKPVAAVLFCHGLAGTKVSTQRLYVRLAHQLAKANIAALRIDFRGNGDSEGELNEVTLEGEVSDALIALDYLKNSPFVDSSRIGILGRSFGGAVAVYAASRFEVDRIALWSPFFDGTHKLKEWEDLEDKSKYNTIEGQPLGDAFFHEMFAMDTEKAVKGIENKPLLIVHSEDDLRVPFDHALRYERLHKGQTEFLRVERSGHEFTDPKEQQLILKKTKEWFL